jgi:DNA helicase-2/ATP-dependent DNA helicase PcrA
MLYIQPVPKQVLITYHFTITLSLTRAKEKLFLSRAERRSTFGVGRANLPSRFLDELPMDLIQLEQRLIKPESLFFQDSSMASLPSIEDRYLGEGMGIFTPEGHHSGDGEVVLSPEGFFPLKIGMRVRHPKFGEGRVRSVEGIDENQKATIVFETVGSRRLKVCYANLEILE